VEFGRGQLTASGGDGGGGIVVVAG